MERAKHLLIAAALALALATQGGCLTYYVLTQKPTAKGMLISESVTAGLGLLWGATYLNCGEMEDGCPDGTGNDNGGEVARSLGWGLGITHFIDAVAAGILALTEMIYEQQRRRN